MLLSKIQKLSLLSISLLVGAIFVAMPLQVMAQTTPPPSDQPQLVKNDCQGDNIRAGAPEGSDDHCGILDYIVLFINVLSGIVGVVIAGSLIFAGIQYSSAGSDPQKVSAAKDRIRNSIIALLFFIFMYGFLNYLVPGGVLT